MPATKRKEERREVLKVGLAQAADLLPQSLPQSALERPQRAPLLNADVRSLAVATVFGENPPMAHAMSTENSPYDHSVAKWQ